MNPVLIPIIAMFIPIVAIAGGMTVAVFRTRGQQKIAELAMRERIAAIEKGLDPSRLPPLPSLADPDDFRPASPRERAMRTSTGLRIGGIITLAAGLGLAVLFIAIPDARDRSLWALGMVPVFVGVGLVVAGQVVRNTAPPETPAASVPGGAPSVP